MCVPPERQSLSRPYSSTLQYVNEKGFLRAADEGKVFPAAAGINSKVSYLDEGAALWSPTTDGAWHLFSIALIPQSESQQN
jgi:hypothetical protein